MPESALLDLRAQDVSERRWEDAIRSMTGQLVNAPHSMRCHERCGGCVDCERCVDCEFCVGCVDCERCHERCHERCGI